MADTAGSSNALDTAVVLAAIQQLQHDVQQKIATLQQNFETGQHDVQQKLETLQQNFETVQQTMDDVRRDAVDTSVHIHRIHRKLDRMQQLVSDELVTIKQHVFGLRPTSEASSYDRGFHERVVQYCGGIDACCILSHVFPVSEGVNVRDTHPAVAEHIFHKGQRIDAERLGIEVHDPRNGLLLLKHIELHYQAGRMTLVPTELPSHEEVRVVIHVSKSLHDVYLQQLLPVRKRRGARRRGSATAAEAQDGSGSVSSTSSAQSPSSSLAAIEECEGEKTEDPAQVRDAEGRCITFGQLHGKCVVMRRPFLRSLYCHMVMARQQDSSVPDPNSEEMRQLFESCDLFDKVCQFLALGSGGSECDPPEFFEEEPLKAE